MINKIDVFYEGWGERWHWGTLAQAPHTTIVFEYSDRALQEGLELSALHLPLSTVSYSEFEQFNEYLPGVIADALPDGWGRLLMDRVLRQQGIDPAQVSVLERLTYISNTAMGAFSFLPQKNLVEADKSDIGLEHLAKEAQLVLEGENSQILIELFELGGSPQGARPKALVYRHPNTERISTLAFAEAEHWLVKFPAKSEHPEVCAIEYLYHACAHQCGLEVPNVEHFNLGNGLAAFGTQRFDRQNTMRVPMQTLAGYLNANFRIPNCDYDTFLRATDHITNHSVIEVKKAFALMLFNIIFNNRDDHTKNFSYVLNQKREWQLAPVYDLTFNEGPNGYHQMSVMGETKSISKKAVMDLARTVDISPTETENIIKHYAKVTSQFSALCNTHFPKEIRPTTAKYIQQVINQNLSKLI